jgi:hypothetical protein
MPRCACTPEGRSDQPSSLKNPVAGSAGAKLMSIQYASGVSGRSALEIPTKDALRGTNGGDLRAASPEV